MKFIHGHAFRDRCGFILDQHGWRKNEAGEPNIVFVKTDFVGQFFATHVPSTPFKLVTHNSDYAIDAKRFCDHPLLVRWYAMNAMLDHPKLRPIPIGIANPEWGHGNQKVLGNAAAVGKTRSGYAYANFNPDTNKQARLECLERSGVSLTPTRKFSVYLSEISSHRFSLCPAGNGPDTHRIWESLYVGTVPVVKREPWVEPLAQQFPILLVDDWAEVKTGLTVESPKLIQDYSNLDFERYFARHIVAD